MQPAILRCGIGGWRRFAGSALLALGLLAGVASRASAEAETEAKPAAASGPPNLLFILADDLRWDALGYCGNAIVQTPNLDRLAARGAVFQNAFATTSICAVSRASLLTGQWMRRHQVDDFAKGLSPEQWRQSYPERLRQAGYRTGFVGKLGVGTEAKVKEAAGHFDFWRGLTGQGSLDFIDAADPTQTHETARLGTQALEFLETAPVEQPFCLSVSFTAVHARDGRPREFQPDRRDEALYADVTIPPPPTATAEDFARLPDFVKASEGRRRWEWRFDTPEKTQRTLRDYYRLISGLDREVGRLLEVLDRRGLSQRTVIVFAGDNGFSLGDRGLADKWFLYEESCRVPALICDPRAPVHGLHVPALVLNVDLAPTLLDLAGLTPSAGMQGRSLLPWVRGETPAGWRAEFFYEHRTLPGIIPPSEGVRTGEWKYIRWTGREPVVEELYHLREDPLERKNLAGEAAAAEKLEELRERWRRLGEELK